MCVFYVNICFKGWRKWRWEK